MAIDSLGSSAATNYSQYSISSPTQTAAQASGGATPPAGSGGRFTSAIGATLAQLTGSSASNTSSAGGSQDAGQAEQAFAQNLFSALQSQFSGQQQNGAQAPAGGEGHHHHHGGGGRLAGALQSLAQQLGASSDSSNSSTTPSADSALQTSFNNVLAATGQ